MLTYPDTDEPFIMDTDASNLAVGGVLSQVQSGEEKWPCMDQKPLLDHKSDVFN